VPKLRGYDHDGDHGLSLFAWAAKELETMSELVTLNFDSGLARLTLSRPEKLNALSAASFREIDRHLAKIESSNAGCVLLSGAGRSFCAGHDLNDIAQGDEEGAVKRLETGVVERLATLPIPVIASVRGHCMTGGLELALAADIILAAETAMFADTHAKWDLVPIWGLSQRLPRRVGIAKAQEMMFACRTYSGSEAVNMGLANSCHPDDALDAAAERLCEDILTNSRRATSAIKKLLQQTDGLSLAAGIAWELHHTAGRGPEFQTRVQQFSRRKG
jgi:enoyl-CoA hydratase